MTYIAVVGALARILHYVPRYSALPLWAVLCSRLMILVLLSVRIKLTEGSTRCLRGIVSYPEEGYKLKAFGNKVPRKLYVREMR
jgi:thiamine transporter ThiT